MTDEQRWWQEDAERHNAMGRMAQVMGFQVRVDPALMIPPPLNPDGSLADPTPATNAEEDEDEDEEPDPAVENRNPKGINQYTKGGGKGAGDEHAKAHAAAIEKAKAKAAVNPRPTSDEKREAKEGIAKLGANKYRRNLVGNTGDRAKRRAALLKEFGDGTHCPCIYCGTKLGPEGAQLEQDKIVTTGQGGRYRLPNLVPSCGPCNKKRSDTKWGSIQWPS